MKSFFDDRAKRFSNVVGRFAGVDFVFDRRSMIVDIIVVTLLCLFNPTQTLLFLV